MNIYIYIHLRWTVCRNVCVFIKYIFFSPFKNHSKKYMIYHHSFLYHTQIPYSTVQTVHRGEMSRESRESDVMCVVCIDVRFL